MKFLYAATLLLGSALAKDVIVPETPSSFIADTESHSTKTHSRLMNDNKISDEQTLEEKTSEQNFQEYLNNWQMEPMNVEFKEINLNEEEIANIQKEWNKVVESEFEEMATMEKELNEALEKGMEQWKEALENDEDLKKIVEDAEKLANLPEKDVADAVKNLAIDIAAKFTGEPKEEITKQVDNMEAEFQTKMATLEKELEQEAKAIEEMVNQFKEEWENAEKEAQEQAEQKEVKEENIE
jgi:DNA repair exonuclease SbcCD ATPase subunit